MHSDKIADPMASPFVRPMVTGHILPDSRRDKEAIIGSKKTLTRIVVADDHEIPRAGIAFLIAQSPHFELCGQADNERDLIALLESTAPDVVVLDLFLGERD